MRKETERLFFALWPTDEVRQQITLVRKKIPDINRGRLVQSSNLHLTLHYLGNIPVDRIDCFLQQAQKVKVRSFNLSLNQVGYFKRPKVLWLGCDKLPDNLLSLHQQLGERLKACGYQAEKRPYNPHITLARKISQAPELGSVNPIVWPVTDFVLVQSIEIEGGVQYRVKQRY